MERLLHTNCLWIKYFQGEFSEFTIFFSIGCESHFPLTLNRLSRNIQHLNNIVDRSFPIFDLSHSSFHLQLCGFILLNGSTLHLRPPCTVSFNSKWFYCVCGDFCIRLGFWEGLQSFIVLFNWQPHR